VAIGQSTIEPASLLKMPSLNDPRSDGSSRSWATRTLSDLWCKSRPSFQAAHRGKLPWKFLRGVIPTSVIFDDHQGKVILDSRPKALVYALGSMYNYLTTSR
jgi:hypothetical protein